MSQLTGTLIVKQPVLSIIAEQYLRMIERQGDVEVPWLVTMHQGGLSNYCGQHNAQMVRGALKEFAHDRCPASAMVFLSDRVFCFTVTQQENGSWRIHGVVGVVGNIDL